MTWPSGSALPLPPVTVHGGAGGTAARLDDLQAAGLRLQRSAATMASIAGQVARIATDPTPAIAAVRSPITWWEAERCLAGALAGRSGAVVVAARYAATAEGALAAVALYRAADVTANAAMRAVDVAAGEVVGRLLAAPVVAGAAAALPLLLPRASSAPAPGPGPGSATGGGAGLSSGPLLSALAAHPDAVEHLSDAAPGVLRGLTGSPLVLLVAAGVTGRPVVPLDVPGAAGWVGSAAGGLPYFRETTSVSVRPGPVTAVSPPRGLADLLAGVASLDPVTGIAPGSVGVLAVRGAAGSRAWVVQIPGTQDWSPRAGRNPLDLTGNVHGMAGEPTAAGQVVTRALTEAGARPSEPVLLVGHSQGGIVAARLAADPAFRHRFAVSHVVTAGSPVALTPVPASVSVLSLEHDHDLVPRVDGSRNPDQLGWITVTAPAELAGARSDAVLSHDLGSYLRTAVAVDASADAGLQRWRAGLTPFLAGDGVTATRMVVAGERG